LEEEEAAFRKDRQTQDHIFTLRKITKWSIYSILRPPSCFSHHTERGNWKALQKLGVTKNLIKKIQSIYERVNWRVQIGEGQSTAIYNSNWPDIPAI
jgi:hypothetical protein